jgi:putative addiction module component (TIGR02574 family)
MAPFKGLNRSSCAIIYIFVIKDTIPQLSTLSAAEKFALAVELWDEFAANPESLDVTEEQLDELDRRYAAYQADPQRVVTWEEAKSKLLTSDH